MQGSGVTVPWLSRIMHSVLPSTSRCQIFSWTRSVRRTVRHAPPRILARIVLYRALQIKKRFSFQVKITSPGKRCLRAPLRRVILLRTPTTPGSELIAFAWLRNVALAPLSHHLCQMHRRKPAIATTLVGLFCPTLISLAAKQQLQGNTRMSSNSFQIWLASRVAVV